MSTAGEHQYEHDGPATEPAGPSVDDTITAFFGGVVAQAAEEETARMRRVLAAIITKVGPVTITQQEFEEAPADALIVFQSVDSDDPDTLRMGWALPDHIDTQEDGSVLLNTSEAMLAEVIDSSCDVEVDADRLATVVVRALGLPIRGEG